MKYPKIFEDFVSHRNVKGFKTSVAVKQHMQQIHQRINPNRPFCEFICLWQRLFVWTKGFEIFHTPKDQLSNSKSKLLHLYKAVQIVWMCAHNEIHFSIYY